MTHTPIDNATLEAMVKAANEAAAGHPVDEYYLVSPRMMAAALAAAPEPFKAVKERGTTNPCDKIFDHKWLSPECVETGCKSLLLAHRAERAEELADKYKWQVRDTCTRAEKAEATIASLRALRALLAEAGEALKSFLHLIKADAEDVENGWPDKLGNLPNSHCFELTWAPEEPGSYITAGQIHRAATTLAAIQTALRDASPTMGNPK